MEIGKIKYSIKIFEYAFKQLDEKHNKWLYELSKIRKPDNVIYLRDVLKENDLGMYTLMASQSIPCLVLLSFTIELTLKLLLKQETEKEYKIHWLKDLFEKLSKQCQTEIIWEVISNLNINQERFYELINENNQTFIDWRYMYENENQNKWSIQFLKIFYEKLKLKIEDLK
ncbi:MAG: hypothetical protein ACD_2C00005G0003 [uncultured bacterium (gcode 4)]|uniref:HEPN domain-containing protein n=1 Tax=uncultured bacterium (gcode 4) TaxID=1234023 RepID=K2G4Y7_9BACT|nr:MAG: hypothetical protein ACD_2C00005G0003 [uncultured bacterium (gcode 4)]